MLLHTTVTLCKTNLYFVAWQSYFLCKPSVHCNFIYRIRQWKYDECTIMPDNAVVSELTLFLGHIRQLPCNHNTSAKKRYLAFTHTACRECEPVCQVSEIYFSTWQWQYLPQEVLIGQDHLRALRYQMTVLNNMSELCFIVLCCFGVFLTGVLWHFVFSAIFPLCHPRPLSGHTGIAGWYLVTTGQRRHG